MDLGEMVSKAINSAQDANNTYSEGHHEEAKKKLMELRDYLNEALPVTAEVPTEPDSPSPQ